MIIAVASWRGTGATTAALALAAAVASRGDGAWLVEADPAGGVLAGRMHLAAYALAGLEQVAFPSQGRAAVEVLHEVAQQIGSFDVVAAPADPYRAFACHQPRVPWVPALTELPGTVVVDVGRLRAGTPVWPLLQVADEVVLATSAEVSEAVASHEWLLAGGRVSHSDPGLDDGRGRVLVVDSPGGVAFPRAGLLADLGDRCVGWLPWDPATVDLLHRGAQVGDRRLRRSPLVHAAQRVHERILGATCRPLESAS